ncbi:hypothetical protein S40288_05209 [Stachybotrys chartarum IBT 40288]|nr:hypothetical protein S40288_05209 [Stachybotrys chartarum IBT 40288]
MEVTFGAVGDFISIAVLIKGLIELLDDSRGSAWEYRSLREQLCLLKQNLDRARDQYNELRGVAEFGDVCDALEKVIDEAERRLEGIAVMVKKYTSTLAENSAKRTIRKVARKVQWSLEKKETDKFLIDLNRYVSIIQSLQFEAFRRLMQRNFDNSKSIHIDTQDLMKQLQTKFDSRLTSLEDELRAVRTNSDTMQQYLLAVGVILTRRLDTITQAVNTFGVAALHGASGIRWFWTSVLGLLTSMHSTIIGRPERPLHLGPFFTFEDYMGVEAVVLLNFIDSWSAFEGSIQGKYKGRKGGRRVAQSRFLLQDRQTGEEIDRDVHWRLAITPGARIDMSLICEVEEDEDEAGLLKCPFCKATPSCQHLFRKLAGLADDEAVPFAPNAPNPARQGSSHTPSNISEGTPLQSKQKKRLEDKIRVKRHRKKTTRSHSGSDSDDTDMVGFKRVAILPISRLHLRPAPFQPMVEGSVVYSEGRLVRQAEVGEFSGAQKSSDGDEYLVSYNEPWSTVDGPQKDDGRRRFMVESWSLHSGPVVLTNDL